jgi:hypothetical protein
MPRQNTVSITWDKKRKSLKLAATGTVTIIVLAVVAIVCLYIWCHH